MSGSEKVNYYLGSIKLDKEVRTKFKHLLIQEGKTMKDKLAEMITNEIKNTKA